MKKILVILSGYPCDRAPWGNSQNHGTPEIMKFQSFYDGQSYHNKILKNFSVDYICTTWDDIGEEEIYAAYHPVIYKSFSQKIFRDNIDQELSSFEENRMNSRTQYYLKYGIENNLVVSSIRFASQLQSRCNAAKLALEYIELTKNHYDAILISRYDISTRGGFNVRHPTVLNHEDFKYLNERIKPRFILPTFDQINCGLPDMWLYMNTSALSYYSNIDTNYIVDIKSKDSEYFYLLTNGWPYSRYFDMHSIYDYRQYSNEFFRNKKSEILMKYPNWEITNLHSYHKYYLLLSSKKPDHTNVKFKSKYTIFMSQVKINKNLLTKSNFKELLFYIKFQIKIIINLISYITKHLKNKYA